MTSKLLCSAFGRADKTLFNNGMNRQMRNFFAYLRIAFNKVDTQRLEEIGPNRLCAEWYGTNFILIFVQIEQRSKNNNSLIISDFFSYFLKDCEKWRCN